MPVYRVGYTKTLFGTILIEADDDDRIQEYLEDVEPLEFVEYAESLMGGYDDSDVELDEIERMPEGYLPDAILNEVMELEEAE